MAGELQRYIVATERADTIKRWEATLEKFPELASDELPQERGFWENVQDFWGAAGHAMMGPLRDLSIWQGMQGRKGAKYIKEMRKLSGQVPYDETGR